MKLFAHFGSNDESTKILTKPDGSARQGYFVQSRCGHRGPLVMPKKQLIRSRGRRNLKLGELMITLHFEMVEGKLSGFIHGDNAIIELV